MGAKLSKKKKGYCLGAGKDGESTDTTEVEQKETETQAGQKDAAEPNGEKIPTDQTLNNDEEQKKTQAEKNSTEVASGDTTKDPLNKDQKSEGKPSAEQKKVEEPKKEQDKPEHAKSSNTAQQMATEGGKGQSQPDEKPQTEHDKESVAKDDPTQESKPVTEKVSEPKQQSPLTEPSAPVPEEKEVAKPIADPETKVKVEKMEKEQTPVRPTEHLSEQATKKPSPVSVKGPGKVPEIVETLVSENALVEPVLKEPVMAPVAEKVESEPANKVVEPENTEVSLPETASATELIKPDPCLAPVTESVESKISEEPKASVPEVKSIEAVATPERAPRHEHQQVSESKKGTESLPEISLPLNEVPDSTAQVEENVKNRETLGNVDLVVETQKATAESAPSAEKSPNRDAIVAENYPSVQAEEIQERKAHEPISKEQEVKDKKMQKEVKEKEESGSDKQPAEHGSLEEDCKDTEEVALDTSKNENDQVSSEETTVHPTAQDKNSGDKAENHKMPAEELSKEPPARLIVGKHGVGNGLPVKEEMKVHLENGCDKDLHELNRQSECREIEVCNE